jgi:hypothetical protein
VWNTETDLYHEGMRLHLQHEIGDGRTDTVLNDVYEQWRQGAIGDAMADNLVMELVTRRYRMKMQVFFPPRQEVLEWVVSGKQRLMLQTFLTHGCNMRNTVMLLHSNLHGEHFEPVVLVEGRPHASSRFGAANAAHHNEAGFDLSMGITFHFAAMVTQEWLTHRTLHCPCIEEGMISEEYFLERYMFCRINKQDWIVCSHENVGENRS